MCKDNYPVNRKTKSDRYPMPIPEELFNAVRFSWVLHFGLEIWLLIAPITCGRSGENRILGS